VSDRPAAPGVYVTLDELSGLRRAAQGTSFLPRQAVASALAGRHRSRIRGRGLSFEELRRYRKGDDIRTIDWKASARTGHVHVRVYNEERERPVLLVVDQSASMFFGSVRAMKSATAARLAAMSAWRVLAVKDRVAMLIFDDQDQHAFAPVSTERGVNRMLEQLVLANGRLSAQAKGEGGLEKALRRAHALISHDALVVVISDFQDLNDPCTSLLQRIRRRNDLILSPIMDPLDEKLPEGSLALSDGELQIRADIDAKVGSAYEAHYAAFMDTLQQLERSLDAGLLPMTTARDESEQLRELLRPRLQP